LRSGGDWYDVMQLPSGDVGAAIGDVVGHDLEAAARMGQARSALRAYATEGHSPSALMGRLNRLLMQTDADFMGTCCYLQLTSRRDTMTLVSAGHPPPLLIDADGRSRTIDLAANLPLGVDEGTSFAETTLTIPRGATLVLYTDGLVESRTLPLDVGLQRITQVPARTGRGDLEQLAEHFVHRVAPRQSGDDLTLLLLRNEGAGPARSPLAEGSRPSTGGAGARSAAD
jgi:serine phosphatase RsbU (regulator of sigma subunit)